MEEPHSRPRGPECEGSNNCKYDQKGKTNSQLRMKVKLILNKGHTIGMVLILDISAKKYFGWDSFVTIGPCQNSNDVRTRQNRDEQGRGGRKEGVTSLLINISLTLVTFSLGANPLFLQSSPRAPHLVCIAHYS